MNKKTRNKIILAALLHDIGKFYQRADDKMENGGFHFLKSDYWNNPATFCPYYNRNGYTHYSHKHVLWTVQFIEEHRTIFNQLNIDAFAGDDSLLRLAALHHKPETALQKIIQKADHYASGTDRSKGKALVEDGLKDDWKNFKRKRMVSIFESIYNEQETYHFTLPVTGEKLSDDGFPKKADSFAQTPDYQSLWEGFVAEFEKIATTDFDLFFETLLSLAEKYWITIPASTQHLPDVSLYDHSKMTAALAVAIYDYLDQQDRTKHFDLDDDESAIMMVGADLSGIQKFIYEIISKNAAKNLKGRSFYLQLLIDSVLRHFLDKLLLTPANIIYSSGGGFFILAAHTKANQEKVEDIEKVLGESLFERHQTELFLAVDSISLTGKTIMHDGDSKVSISDVWKRLIQKINIKKRQKFAYQLVTHYDAFFGDDTPDLGGKQKRDAITGQELRSGHIKSLKDNTQVSTATFEQIELGKKLYRAQYIVVYKEPIDRFFMQPLGLEYCYHFWESIDEQRLPTGAKVIRLNETDFLKGQKGVGYSYRFYGGNKYPVDERDNPKSFDKLASTGDFKRLGILRMDIDNLGQIFKDGFPEQKRTFSRYATLSRSLDFFFKGYLNIIQDQYPDTLILYAGGDDLFILGNWIQVLEMSEKIQQKFRQWTAFNPSLTLSGGMALVTPKFPILKAAELAGQEEKNAKAYAYDGFTKNAFSLFGKALSWEAGREFDIVKELKFNLLGWLDAEKLPKSFYGLIHSFAEKRERQIKNKANESWQWQLAYMLARFQAKDQKLKDFINQVKNDIFTNKYKGDTLHSQYHYLELLNLAARWADLEHRSS